MGSRTAVASVTAEPPPSEKKTPLTFESYRRVTDFFGPARMDERQNTIWYRAPAAIFRSGGDVFEIIGPVEYRGYQGLNRLHPQ